MVATLDTVVDLIFAARGGPIPADHGYALFGALCRVVPALHDAEEFGVHPIAGQPVGNRLLELTDRSRLALRLPASRIAEALPLAGQRLEIDGTFLTVGVPTTRTLRPAPVATSRLVVIKGFMEPAGFLEAARRQLAEIDPGAEALLFARRAGRSLEGTTAHDQGTPLRRTLHIRDKEIVGYALAVQRLSSDGSLALQSAGLGGRRRFGCGVFVPVLR